MRLTRIHRDAARHCAVAALALAAALVLAGAGWAAGGAALGLFVGVAVAVIAGLSRPATPRRFGAANAVTLARATAMAFLLALLPGVDQHRGLAFAVGASAFLLDGLDGWLARRTGSASAFGARFDMETDALTVLILSLLVAASGQAGPWVIALGLLRYGFGALALRWPTLTRPAPGERRRKAICALVVAALVMALAPIDAALAAPLCAAALALLIYSFGSDVAFQLRAGRIGFRPPGLAR